MLERDGGMTFEDKHPHMPAMPGEEALFENATEVHRGRRSVEDGMQKIISFNKMIDFAHALIFILLE